MTHTKGKWEYNGRRIMSNEVAIATLHKMNPKNDFTPTKKEAEANAQRIVECVNGWDKLESENAKLKSDVTSSLALSTARSIRVDELTEQVEKLKGALNNAIQDISNKGMHINSDKQVDIIKNMQTSINKIANQ